MRRELLRGRLLSDILWGQVSPFCPLEKPFPGYPRYAAGRTGRRAAMQGLSLCWRSRHLPLLQERAPGRWLRCAPAIARCSQLLRAGSAQRSGGTRIGILTSVRCQASASCLLASCWGDRGRGNTARSCLDTEPGVCTRVCPPALTPRVARPWVPAGWGKESHQGETSGQSGPGLGSCFCPARGPQTGREPKQPHCPVRARGLASAPACITPSREIPGVLREEGGGKPPLHPYGGVLVAHQDSRVPPRKPPRQKGAHVGQQEDQRQHISRGLKLSPCFLKGTLLLLFTAELLKIRPLDRGPVRGPGLCPDTCSCESGVQTTSPFSPSDRV